MKKILISLLALLWLIPMAEAVPARPGSYRYKQPDGTVILLQKHGDEYFHWTTDASGRIVEKGADGFYRSVNPVTHARRARAAREKAQIRRSAWASFDNPPATNFGDRKILCILAEFQPEVDEDGNVLFDGKYILENPNRHFSDMLNKAGYDYDGATGSVRDYYMDNSRNQYRPQFDVFGPVTLSQSESYYDDHGPGEAIIEACEMMPEINIADYDTDNDGCIDMVLFYFPGHNEAEWAPEWTIWPHQGTGYFGELDGKAFIRYFCTSELRGSEGNDAAAIGTTCHEFAHALGLPDFYDVNYEENGSNDFTTEFFDLMCSGNYNDEGRMPPYLSAVERNMLGWMPYPTTLSSDGSHTLLGVQNNQAYRIDGRETGEYFILECRDGNKWDSYLDYLGATGLLIYHVDQSEREVPGSGYTAAYLWSNTNDINSFGGHPCYYLIASADKPEYYNDYVFPGNGNVTVFEPTDWDGNPASILLSNIVFKDGKVTFGTSLSGGRMIFGHVKDAYGKPIPDVTVALSRSVYAFAAPSILSTDRTCRTDANGYYSFELAEDASEFQVVSVRPDGYWPDSRNVRASGLYTQQDFSLIKLGQVPPATLQKYDESLSMYAGGLGSGDIAVGMRYSASELAEKGAVGAKISEISFACGAETGSTVYVLVDIGGERKLLKDVSDTYQRGEIVTVNVSAENIVLPAGKDVYIGYGVKDVPEDSYPFYIYGPRETGEQGTYVLYDFQTSSGWYPISYGGNFDFVISAMLAQTGEVDFSAFGVSYIKLVDGVPQVVPAAGKTLHSVTWYLDGVALSGEPGAVSDLSAGAHTYMARISYYDGTGERVYYDVTAE